MKPKTLPTLELLRVHLAVKCLPTLLGVYSHIKIDNIYLSVDAQVVLSWIFSDNFKTKSLYTRNRIKDIHQMIKEIDSKYSIKIHFKYVTFSENPADLLSRGIPFEKFQQNLTYWTCGPNWLSENPLKWPDNNLNCLNAANKDIIQSINLHNTATYPKLKPMIPFERFSKLTKLIKATAFVSKFIDKCKHNKDCLESDHITKLYLSKVMQEQTFFKEIAYIKNPKENKIPDLVRSLNLFLDSDRLLRTDCRIANTSGYKYFRSKKGVPTHSANRLQRLSVILLNYNFKIQ